MNPQPSKTAEDLLREVDAPPSPPPSDIVPRELSIEVDYRLGDGTALQGAFVHRVPTVDEERKVALVSAGLRGGHAREAFSAYEAESIDAIAYLTVALAHRPAWAAEKGLGAVLDPGLLFSLYREALAHRERFRLASRDLRPGQGAA